MFLNQPCQEKEKLLANIKQVQEIPIFHVKLKTISVKFILKSWTTDKVWSTWFQMTESFLMKAVQDEMYSEELASVASFYNDFSPSSGPTANIDETV